MSESIYTDQEIHDLIAETKILPANWGQEFKKGDNRSSTTFTFTIQGENNKFFHIIKRVNNINTSNFSVILGVSIDSQKKTFRLKRYDGKHKHTNPIEENSFNNFHIHTATERYQNHGTGEEDKYAEITDRFTNVDNALECLINDCGFILEENPQTSLLLET